MNLNLRKLLDGEEGTLLFGILRGEIQTCEEYTRTSFTSRDWWQDRLDRTEALLEKLESA